MADNYQIDLTLDEIFGTGISSIEQTTVSTMPGGENVWTVTLTNGNSYDFTVLNGTAGGDPIPALTVSAMTDTSVVYLYLGSETGYTFGHWYYYNGAWTDGGAYGAKGDKGDDGFSPTASVSKSGTTTTITITDENGTTTAEVEDGVAPEAMIAEKVSDWLDENITEPTGVVIDTSLQVAGAAADSKAVGDEISDLRSAIATGGGFNAEVKQALMNLANAVAFKSNVPLGQTLIDALEDALYPPVDLVSISAVYTQSGTVYDTDSLDSLKADLVVTAHYSDSTTGIITNYALSGVLSVGTSTVTVSYGGKTATFEVTVSASSTVEYFNGYGLGWQTNVGAAKQYAYNCMSSTANRMIRVETNGDHAIQAMNGSVDSGKEVTIYPIPVPSDATKLTVVVPSNVASAVNFVKWNGSVWLLATSSASVWNFGTYEYDISSVNDGSLYYGCLFKNSADSTAINTEDTSSWTYTFS